MAWPIIVLSSVNMWDRNRESSHPKQNKTKNCVYLWPGLKLHTDKEPRTQEKSWGKNLEIIRYLLVYSINRASLIAQLVKIICLQCRRPRFNSWVGRSTGEGVGYPLQYSWASLVAQLVKNSSAMRETWVQSLGWEDPLEKGKATHSSILA